MKFFKTCGTFLLLLVGMGVARPQTAYPPAPYVFTYGNSWRGFWLLSKNYQDIGVPPGPEDVFSFASPAGGVARGTVSDFTFHYDAAGSLIGAHVNGKGTRRDVYMRYSSVTMGAEIKVYAPGAGTVSINVRDATGKVVMSTSGYVYPGAFVVKLCDGKQVL